MTAVDSDAIIRPMLNTAFTATAYGQTITGTADMFGWEADERSKAILSAMEPRKARRAALRCMRAASKAYDAAHEARCVRNLHESDDYARHGLSEGW